MSNQGTMLKPNMRGRESVVTSAPVTNPAVARSYLRPDPSTPTPPILPDTYANTTTLLRADQQWAAVLFRNKSCLRRNYRTGVNTLHGC